MKEETCPCCARIQIQDQKDKVLGEPSSKDGGCQRGFKPWVGEKLDNFQVPLS